MLLRREPLICSSGVGGHNRLPRRARQVVLVLCSRHSLQSTSLHHERVGSRWRRTIYTPAARSISVKPDTGGTTYLSGCISNAVDVLIRRGHREKQRRVSARAHDVEQSESEEQEAVRHVLSLRLELDSLRTQQLSLACSTAIRKLDALCQSGHHEEVAAAFAQDMMLQKGALQEGILQEGVFPTLEGLWLDEQVSSLGGPVSDLLLSLVQALPAHVASSVKLLPNGDVCLVDLPRHWQVLSMQPILPEIEVEAPVFFRRMVASSNVKVKTSAVLLMLLLVVGCKYQLAKAAKDGVDTMVLEQMLQTVNSWSVLKDDAGPERSQSFQTSNEAPDAQPQADSSAVATTLPFVAAARVLDTLVYWHRLSAQQQDFNRQHVRINREMVIACCALSSCSRQHLQKVAQPDEEDPDRTNYERYWLDQVLSPEKEVKELLPWLEQCCTELDVDTSKRAEIRSMVDTTQLLQLSSKLQKCQILSEGWYTSTQGNAFKLFVEMLRSCMTTVLSPVQHSKAERNATIRSFMPYLVDMLHHPSEHVRGYAARHMAYLHRFAGDIVASTVLNESRGGLGRLLLHLANSKDFGVRASYASLIGVCSLHCDAHVLEQLNNAGTCQLVYSLLEQADSDSSKSQLLYSLAWLTSKSEKMSASIARVNSVRLLTQMVESSLGDTMIVPRGAKGEVLCGSLKLLCPLLEVCRSSTDLHGESDLIVTAIGAMITVFQKSSLVDSTSEMVNDALGCLHHLTTFPEGRQQALQLLTVDKIEALQKAALTWLEDDFQPANHWAIAAGLISMTTDLPEGRHVLTNRPVLTKRHVLTKRSLSGRVAAVFTSDYCSDDLQAALLPVCATLSVLMKNGSYARSPWLTRQQAYTPADELALDEAAALHALSMYEASPQLSVMPSGQQRMGLQQVGQGGRWKGWVGGQTPVEPSGQRRMTQQVQQAGQQSSLLQQPVQQLVTQPVQHSEGQPVQQESTQGVHELSPATTMTPKSLVRNFSWGSEVQEIVREIRRDVSPLWMELTKQKPGSRYSIEVQHVSWKVWHDILVATAVSLTGSKTSYSRENAMSWLARLVFTVTDKAGKALVQAGAVQASLRLLQQGDEFSLSRLAAMQFCLRLHHRGLLPADLLLTADAHQQLTDIFTGSILDSFKLGQKPRLPSPETDLPCLADESYATKTMAAPLLCLLWQHRPNLVSQFVYQHPISSLPGLTARDHSAYGPLLGPVLMRGVLWGFLHHEEGLAFTKQLSQLVSWFLGNCNWLLDQYSTGDGAFMAEVLEEALVQHMELLCSMANSPLYLSAVRSSGSAIVCARINGGLFHQAESCRAQQLTTIAKELSNKLARADA